MTTGVLAAQTHALRRGAGVFAARRDVLLVRGPDAPAYLQGQLSQDLDALDVNQSADSLLLEPDGKLSALVRATRTGPDAFVIDVDAGYGKAVAARLTRFLLRSKVELERLAWQCLSLRGDRVTERSSEVVAALPADAVRAVRFEWNGWTGLDLLGSPEAVRGVHTVLGDHLGTDPVECGVEAVEACRIVSGLPAMGAELTEKTIAAEAGLVGRTVSFTKGCYTGQELVARLDARGSRVARRLVGVVAPPGPPPTSAGGDEVLARGMTLHAGDPPPGDGPAEDKVVGTITSAIWSVELGSWVALGYLHRSVDAPGTVRVRSGDGVGGSRPARVATLPLVGLPSPSTG